MADTTPLPLTISEWKTSQLSGQGLERLLCLVDEQQSTKEATKAWISIATRRQIEDQWTLLHRRPNATTLPLYGVPFAAKDNIDAEGFVSTAACPAFSSKPATSDSHVVHRLKAAGAILVGKTNLDQFATGLVGTRSPYGAVPNSFDSSRVSGGSSSGSAVVVARGAVPFSLGTDTAGSGRVPAGFNNIIGLKPTRGALSARGVVPACRTLDCVSIFALTVEDAEQVLSVAEGYDVQDSYSRSRPQATLSRPPGLGNGPRASHPVLATPANPDWFGRDDHSPAYQRALEKAQKIGWRCEAVDFAPLLQLAQLLYAGPWVAERYQAIRSFIESHPDSMDPVVRGILQSASKYSAADTFGGEYFRQDLARQIEQAFSKFDALIVPTTPTFPTLAQLVEKPVEENSNLGTYTNFVNFLDWSAISVPAGFRDDGLPFGITLIANTWDEPQLLDLARRWVSGENRRLGATSTEKKEPIVYASLQPGSDRIPVAVVGAHLTGFPLNKDLTSRGATLSRATWTSKQYRLFALQSSSGPKKPGLQRVPDASDGAHIEVEVWDLPTASMASFMATVPSPLSIGKIELENGSWVQGFVCEPWGLEGATDVTHFGGWRAYISSLQVSKPVKRISRVLIANRGEIAVRIIKTLRKLGIASIAIYSEVDAHAPHIRDADVALRLEGTSVSETYLNSAQILELAKSASAEAVIPGYGFLSENADFATAVEKAGLIWIGPTPQQMSDLGLKHKAREIAIAADVPIVPGSQGLLQSIEEAVVEAARIGYPLMLKSTAGGGGIGLTHCEDETTLRDAFAGVQRQAQNNFGNAGVFLERFVQHARHIEVQIFGRGNGEVIAAGERDCSLQRRHQKVVEESPAAMVPEGVRREMAAAAVRIASSVNYRNVGTVEFVYDIDTNEFYFLEINTRLQVEHPVTESVTGLDLVEQMVNIANERCDDLFSAGKQGLKIAGASIEVRVYAESPLQSFQPCAGRVAELSFPDSLRVDTWIAQGTEITTSYDPMIAKLIASGSDRKEAIERLAKGVKDTVIEGVQTNLDYLRQIVASELFKSGKYTTKSLDSFQIVSNTFEVIEPGPLTTIQAYPGRVGYWSVGIPPSGPMDDYSFRIANSLLGNPEDAAGLECTHQGPTLRFHCRTAIVVAGAEAEVTLDDKVVPANHIIEVKASQKLRVGTAEKGYRVYISIKGGVSVRATMGSRATFELGNLGGLNGRKLQARDILNIAPTTKDESLEMRSFKPLPLPASPNAQWTVRVIPGPHTTPDYFTTSSFEALFTSEWKVHHNSNRLGVRLTGPHPEWARSTGGEAGLHPSNINDSPYSIGSVSFTGDEAVILTQDGPSLGGFVVFCVIATADMWKIGQARPGDVVRFDPISSDDAIGLQKQVDEEVKTLKSVSGPAITEISLQQRLADNPAIVGCLDQDGQHVVARKAGDRAMLLEFGTAFDIRQSFAIFAFCEQHRKTPIEGVEELAPGVFTLHVTYERGLSSNTMFDRISKHFGSYTTPTKLPSRTLSLPLAFDDQVCRKAIERYSATIRNDAPWLPSNIKFLEGLNGVEDISDLLNSATYLVLGLGDVFMGSPCAIPLDPRHRLFGTKYNPSRSFTPRGAVGIGGQYLCIYATDSPGGYQIIGRTKDIWDADLIGQAQQGSGQKTPWLFRLFDRITFYPVKEADLADSPIRVTEGELDLVEYEAWLRDNEADIKAKATQQAQAIASYPLREDLLKPFHPSEQSSTYSHGLSSASVPGEVVRAAMPGRCYRVSVKEGEEVAQGDVVLCIESSKMEVEIRSPVSGKCVAVQVKAGDLVNANDDLIVIDT